MSATDSPRLVFLGIQEVSFPPQGNRPGSLVETEVYAEIPSHRLHVRYPGETRPRSLVENHSVADTVTALGTVRKRPRRQLEDAKPTDEVGEAFTARKAWMPHPWAGRP